MGAPEKEGFSKNIISILVKVLNPTFRKHLAAVHFQKYYCGPGRSLLPVTSQQTRQYDPDQGLSAAEVPAGQMVTSETVFVW